MIELSSFQLGALIGLSLFCLVLLAVLLTVLMIRKNKVIDNMNELTKKLKDNESERLKSFDSVFRPYFENREKELTKFSSKALENEKRFYQSLVDIYGGKDVAEVRNLDQHVQQLLKPHSRVLEHDARKIQESLIQQNNSLRMQLMSNEEALDELFEQYANVTNFDKNINPKKLDAKAKLDMIRKSPLTRGGLSGDDGSIRELETELARYKAESAEKHPLLKELWESYAEKHNLELSEEDMADMNMEELLKRLELHKNYDLDKDQPDLDYLAKAEAAPEDATKATIAKASDESDEDSRATIAKADPAETSDNSQETLDQISDAPDAEPRPSSDKEEKDAKYLYKKKDGEE